MSASSRRRCRLPIAPPSPACGTAPWRRTQTLSAGRAAERLACPTLRAGEERETERGRRAREGREELRGGEGWRRDRGTEGERQVGREWQGGREGRREGGREGGREEALCARGAAVAWRRGRGAATEGDRTGSCEHAQQRSLLPHHGWGSSRGCRAFYFPISTFLLALSN